MVVLVSLITAVIYGAGDFCGGLAAKRCRAIEVVAASHVIGLIGAVIVSLAVGSAFRFDDLALGAIGGLFGGLGVLLLYRRLAVGPMHVVAPLTAVTSAVVPTLWGFVIGERLGPLVVVGLILALAAIALVSRSTPDPNEAMVTSAVVAESLLAGAGFGAFFIALDATDSASAPWPVASARLLTAAGLILYLGTQRLRADRPPPVPRSRSLWLLLIAVGGFDTAANVGFLYAASQGSLAVASVLTSLYPISTVVLARYVLGERMNSLQQMGFVGALAASVIIAAG